MISYDEEDAEALLEAGVILGPSLFLIGQAGVLLAVFVMFPVVYGVDQSVYQISLFDPLRTSDDDNEVVEAEIVDEE